MKVAVVRKAHFNAAHRLYNKDWSEERNQQVFGRCNNPNFHGHNYELHVKVIGEQDPQTGYVIDLSDLNEIIQDRVVDRFDHKNLNEDIDDFEDKIPTTENLAIVIYQRLRQQLSDKYELKIRLFETERNYVEYPP